MLLVRDSASHLFAGIFGMLLCPALPVAAGDYGNGTIVNQISDRCAQFGNDFVDVGNGVCGRIETHTRVYVSRSNGLNAAGATSWPPHATSNAALRSDAIVPGAQVTHLRIHGSLDSPNPFR